MSSLLHLESKKVRMVGIWGPSGIGKTTIARALFSQLSCQFQSSVFIDRFFISKHMEVYSRANLVDYNMKLHLQRAFLAEILDKKDIKIDHIGAMEKMLKHRKALIVIDDLDDQDVLDALAGRDHFGYKK
ncbi:Disease resistance protein RPS6 [Cardamine amara subsp. amara]|uniref:Disease resistance protein RPS6 n=1 Tax=Cardamine amara subsp. amara TaxID=228776 RepID=A0ABD1BTJ5_CARAN